MDVFDPRGIAPSDVKPAARRPASLRGFLARFATIDPARFKDRSSEDEISIAPAPEDIMVIVAGGPGKHSAIIPTFGATRSVTVRI